MRTKGFNHQEITHLWTHQTQPKAEGSRMFFEGPTIYSYGHHFPIASIYKKRGEKIVLFTTANYSSSTGKHKSYTRRAIPASFEVFEVPNVRGAYREELSAGCHEDNLKSYAFRIQRAWEKAAKSRKYGEMHLRDAEALHVEAIKYCRWFKLPKPKFTGRPSSKQIEEIRERAKAAAAANRIAEAKERAERVAKEAEAREKWIAGEPTGYIHNPALLRVVGAELVTSMGARVPVSHAARALRILDKLHAKGAEYHRNGHTIHIGHYEIDSLVGNEIKAGCHVIEWPEVERVRAAVIEAAKHTPDAETETA